MLEGSRQDKASELLRRIASEFYEREGNRSALISVTKVDISRDFKNATIFLSVFPEKEESKAFEFATRKLGDLRDSMKKKFMGKTLPFLSVVIDIGEKNRQRIEEISISDTLGK